VIKNIFCKMNIMLTVIFLKWNDYSLVSELSLYIYMYINSLSLSYSRSFLSHDMEYMMRIMYICMWTPIDNSSYSVGKQRSNANVSICANDIQSLCYGCLHTYQYIDE
jgi:hypothetical protein